MRKHYFRILFFSAIVLSVPLVSRAEIKNINPSEACDFMSTRGMATRGYKNPDGIGYFCSSSYIEMGSGLPVKNNIAYYAEGDAEKVTNLKLVLNVNFKQEAKQAHTELANSSEILMERALNAHLPQQVKEAILAGKNGKEKIGNVNIIITRVDWPTGKGYELKYVVEWP